MNSYIIIPLIAISLSMDAFSLSLAFGMQGIEHKKKLFMSIIVGIYHFIMPLIGVYFGNFIIKNISSYLNETYLITFEIGYKQYQDIENIIKKYLPNSYIKLEQDYSQKDRFIFISNTILN